MRYDVDDWVQTDITKQSRLNYDYHWQHEIITKVNGNTNESKIELGDETITVTFRDYVHHILFGPRTQLLKVICNRQNALHLAASSPQHEQS